jgi:hypothetical protein
MTTEASVEKMVEGLRWCAADTLPCSEKRVLEEIETLGLSDATRAKVYGAAGRVIAAYLHTQPSRRSKENDPISQ